MEKSIHKYTKEKRKKDPDPGIKPASLVLAGRFFNTKPPGKPENHLQIVIKRIIYLMVG